MCNFFGFSILPVFHVVYGWFFSNLELCYSQSQDVVLFLILGLSLQNCITIHVPAIFFMATCNHSTDLNEDMTIVVVIAFII